VRDLAKPWQELKKELEEQTKKVFLTCPDELKRFHYGLITHSDAGKYALNQYLGHWVHLYSGYFSYADSILPLLLHLATDPDFDLKELKKLFCMVTPSGGAMSSYAGQKTWDKYGGEMKEALDTVQTKEEFIELGKVWHAFFSRLYWWCHWYFPWGLGPSACPRLSPEDVKEIVRLSQPS